jgi:hypothetical protein
LLRLAQTDEARMTTHSGTPQASDARERIMKRLESLIEERTALGQAFDAYIKGSLTSTDCITLVDAVLREFVQSADVSPRNAVLLDVVTDAVAQLANHDR